MAVYGIAFYGIGRFGRDPNIIRPDFSVEPFKSTPLDYQTLHITWQKPISTDCVYLRLVRNRNNLPQDENDGIPLWGDTTTTPTYMDFVQRVPSFTDTGVNLLLPPPPIPSTPVPGLSSGFQYYTMFGYDGNPQSPTYQTWIRCSDLIGLVPFNYGYGDQYYNLLPMAYRDRDFVMVDPYNPWPVNGALPPLKRYLGLLGFQMDFIRTELESLRSVNDPLNCSGALLPLMAQQLGLFHEPEIGMQQERQLIQNAIHLYKIKGSPRGITEFTSIMTSYPATVMTHHGYNELLMLDDSIFLDDVGSWQAWPPVGTNFPTVSGNVGLHLTSHANMLSGPSAIQGMSQDPVGKVIDVGTSALVYPNGLPSTLQPPYTDSGMGIQASGTNLITGDSVSFDGGTVGNWTPGANTTVANNSHYGYTGTHSLQLTPTLKGDISARLANQAVTAGVSYLFGMRFRNLATTTAANRQVWCLIQWYNNTGTLISTTTGNQVKEIIGKWVAAIVKDTAPAGATTATLVAYVQGCAAGVVHLVDNASLGTGNQDLYVTTGGIPITDFVSSSYQGGHATFRFQVYSETARTIEVSLWGDNGSGTPVQVLAPATFTSQASKWVKYDLSGVINPYPGVPPAASQPQSLPYGPASYYTLYPRVRIEGVTTDSHFTTLDCLYPCIPSKITTNIPGGYDYPRDVKINLQPQFTNLLSNPITTFSRPNPNYDNTQPISPSNEPTILTGFDGLSNAVDPMTPTGQQTSAAMSVRYQTTEDPQQSIAIYGNAALQVSAGGPDATIWFGRVSTWSSPPPLPYGWFASARSSGPTYPSGLPHGTRNDWYFGATQGAPNPRAWFDPIYSWWFEPQSYYATGDPNSWINGQWFSPPPQPTYPGVSGSFLPFTVQAGQSFNFSVYGRFISVLAPNNAWLELGLRWYYPDGTFVECWGAPNNSYGYTVNPTYDRDSLPPAITQYTFLGDPPPEAMSGVLPTTVFPFVRFTRAQSAVFLLNAAMLSPGVALNDFIDASSFSQSSGDFVVDPVSNASYVYRRRIPRTTRLNTELYRWIPAGSTYTLVYSAGAVQAPLDPTLW